MFLKITSGICLFMLLCSSVFSQTHSSVSLENQVYHVLEQAELRGLCTPLSGARPYTRSVIIGKINEILNSENPKRLGETERDILEQYLGKFSKPKNGIDWQRGAWHGETGVGKNDTPLSMNIGVTADMEGSTGIYSADNRYFGTEDWLGLYLNGDLGTHVSYDFTFEGGLMRSPRQYLGKYNTYYKDFNDSKQYQNQEIDVYSEPLTHFPYSYKKRWDGSIFFFSEPTIFSSWPESMAGGYSLPAELTASFFKNRLIMRLGRISHEWGSTSFGSSLALNQNARPFLGIETDFFPVSWVGISSLTGVLEYSNLYGIKESSSTFQNAFSITMLQFRYKNYLFFDAVDAVIWPKRFELGYASPVTNSFFYQNNIGDFDNMAMIFNLKVQYPGWGNIWFSSFIDEINLMSDLLTLDRQMVTLQAGMNIPLPLLSFSSLKMSYTKVNPYCYTHNRNYNPWYGDLRMETAYINNGVNLGYYLPPNSDEILIRYKTMPVKNVNTHLQYQLIRHGADFGSNAVDGSNLLSELDTSGRDDNPILKRFFLHDGAYQWSHIVKFGAEWTLPKAPIALYGEAGVNYSYFTNTQEAANSGKKNVYSRVNTSEYPESTGYIVQLGVKIFPR